MIFAAHFKITDVDNNIAIKIFDRFNRANYRLNRTKQLIRSHAWLESCLGSEFGQNLQGKFQKLQEYRLDADQELRALKSASMAGDLDRIYMTKTELEDLSMKTATLHPAFKDLADQLRVRVEWVDYWPRTFR